MVSKMIATETLPVYTVPSTWTRPFHRPTEEPYKRVVGMPNNGEIVWVDPDMTVDPDGSYSPKDAEVTLIPSNPQFASRVVDFFSRYIADCRGENLSVDSYNCHFFGLWMNGGSNSNGRELRPPDEMVDGEPAGDRRLALGQRGVIGLKFRGHTAAIHTIVGLGIDSPDCIQVMAVDGHMGITSYESTMDHYYSPTYRSSPDHRDYGLYL